MGRLQKILLNSVLIAVLPLCTAMAAEGDEAMPADFDPMEGMSTVDSRMLRMNSPVIGYQPLSVAGQEIDATYLEEVLGERHGAIILLHDQGEQFESRGVVTPLRHRLPEYGWSTLTLALDFPMDMNILLSPESSPSLEAVMDEPVLDELEQISAPDKEPMEKPAGEAMEELIEESNSELSNGISNQQRIEAAISFLQSQGIERIIFIGHGMGGNLAVEQLDVISTPISALILINTPILTTNEVFKTLEQPIFDIYGGKSLDGVSGAVNDRKLTMKRSGSQQYTMRKMDGADHVFSGLQPILVSTIRGWLKTTFLEQEAN